MKFVKIINFESVRYFGLSKIDKESLKKGKKETIKTIILISYST